MEKMKAGYGYSKTKLFLENLHLTYFKYHINWNREENVKIVLIFKKLNPH